MSDLMQAIKSAALQANAKLSLLDLDPEEDFYTQGLDSLDHVQILMKVEEFSGVQFGDGDYDACSCLQQIEQFLLGRGHMENGNFVARPS